MWNTRGNLPLIDAIGNTLQLGDRVVYSWPDASCLSPAKITGFGKSKIHITLDYGGCKWVRPSSVCCYSKKEKFTA